MPGPNKFSQIDFLTSLGASPIFFGSLELEKPNNEEIFDEGALLFVVVCSDSYLQRS